MQEWLPAGMYILPDIRAGCPDNSRIVHIRTVRCMNRMTGNIRIPDNCSDCSAVHNIADIRPVLKAEEAGIRELPD